jgi:hypothetical protein
MDGILKHMDVLFGAVEHKGGAYEIATLYLCNL